MNGKKTTAPKAARGDAQPAAEHKPPAPEALQKIRSRYPAPPDHKVKGYRSQFSDAICAELGTRTKARLVLLEAQSWAVIIDRGLRTPGIEKILKYTPDRFGFYFDCMDTLETNLREQQVRQGAVKDIKRANEDAEKAARAASETLGETLADVAGEREKEEAELAGLPATLTSPDDRAERLRKMVELGRRWTKRKDPELQVLIEEYALDEAALASAEKAAADLESTRPEARGNRVEPHDSPAVNLVEGRMLVEMKVVKRLFDRARLVNKAIPAVIPGAGTRAVLSPRPKVAAAKGQGKKEKQGPADGGAAKLKTEGGAG